MRTHCGVRLRCQSSCGKREHQPEGAVPRSDVRGELANSIARRLTLFRNRPTSILTITATSFTVSPLRSSREITSQHQAIHSKMIAEPRHPHGLICLAANRNFMSASSGLFELSVPAAKLMQFNSRIVEAGHEVHRAAPPSVSWSGCGLAIDRLGRCRLEVNAFPSASHRRGI